MCVCGDIFGMHEAKHFRFGLTIVSRNYSRWLDRIAQYRVCSGSPMIICLLQAFSYGIFSYSFAVINKISTDTVCLHGPSAVTEFLVAHDVC